MALETMPSQDRPNITLKMWRGKGKRLGGKQDSKPRTRYPSTTVNHGMRLYDDVLNDFAVDVGESVVSAAITVGQLFVVEPHLIEDRRM